ncbi:MAG TPA: hypothetical protein VL021_05545 [Brumimicrobium sp.]|nr:hypothetical protein [Brumimicrobium sp.]
MKKLLFIGILFGGVALTSCSKDWVCECQEYGEVTTYPIKDKTKKQAKKQCRGDVSIGLVNVGGDENCVVK